MDTITLIWGEVKVQLEHNVSNELNETVILFLAIYLGNKYYCMLFSNSILTFYKRK